MDATEILREADAVLSRYRVGALPEELALLVQIEKREKEWARAWLEAVRRHSLGEDAPPPPDTAQEGLDDAKQFGRDARGATLVTALAAKLTVFTTEVRGPHPDWYRKMVGTLIMMLATSTAKLAKSAARSARRN